MAISRSSEAAWIAAVDSGSTAGLHVQSLGYNLIGNGTDASGFIGTDLVGTTPRPIDPKLGPLQNNGGPRQTMALLPGSE